MEVKRKVLKGLAPDLHGSAWDYAAEMVAKDPDNLCIVPDLESGFPLVMTIEQRDKIAATWEACKPSPTFNTLIHGKCFIYGTGGKLDGNNFMSDWYKNQG